MDLDVDFVDVFQVRGCARQRRGHFYRPIVQGNTITFCYLGLDGIFRQTFIELFPKPEFVNERTVRWNLNLPPLRQFWLQLLVIPTVGKAERNTRRRPRMGREDYRTHLERRRQAFQAWESASTHFNSSNEAFDDALATATEDFHALQIPDGEQRIIAAGIPWFATIFGRDSILQSPSLWRVRRRRR